MRASIGVGLFLVACSSGSEKPRAATGSGTAPPVGVDAAAAVAAVDAAPRIPEVALPGVDLLGDPLPLPDRVSAQLGSGRLRHGTGASWASWSADGTAIVTAGGNTVRLWSATGELIRDLAVEAREMKLAAVSPDAQLVVGGDRQLVAWGRDGQERWKVDLDQEDLRDLAFSPDGKLIAAASENTAQEYDYVPPERGLWLLAAATGDRLLKLPEVDEAPHESVAFSPDGTLVAVSGSGTHIYDVATGKKVTKIKGGGDDVVFTPDGAALLWTDFYAVVRYDRKKKKEKRFPISSEKQGFIESMSIAPDGASLVISVAGKLRVLDPVTLKEQRVIEGGGAWVTHAEHSPDGQRLVLAMEQRHSQIVDLATGKLQVFAPGHSAAINRVAFSPSGDRVATGGLDHAVMIWDLAGNLLATIAGHANQVTGLCFSPDGARIASVDRDGGAIVSTVADGASIATVEVGVGLSDVQFLPDGRVLLAAGYDPSLIWTVGAKPEPLELSTEGISAFAVSSDQRLLFVGGSDGLLLDAGTLAEVRKVEVWGSYHDAAFSRDGTLIAVGSANGVELGEVATGKNLIRMFGHHQTGVAWGLDNTWIATTGWNAASIASLYATPWKLTSGPTLDPWHAASEYGAISVDVSPDGRRLVTGHSNGVALIWSANAR